MNKSGQSAGFAWIYGIVMLFAIGIMYIVFNQVFTANLVPVIKDQVNMSYSYGGIDITTQEQIYGGIDKYMDFFHAIPYILFIIIIVYMILASIRKEADSMYR